MKKVRKITDSNLKNNKVGDNSNIKTTSVKGLEFVRIYDYETLNLFKSFLNNNSNNKEKVRIRK